MRWRGLMAYLASPTPSCSLVCSRVFGCFPPHPTTCCVTITHLSVSRQQPTASPIASHHASLASPTPEATTRKQQDDLDDTHQPRPHPRTLEKPTPAPQKSSTSDQPRRPRRPRRRPAHPPTPSNTLEHAHSPHHRHPPRPATRPTPRPAGTPTPSNTRKTSPIDTNHGHKATTNTHRTDHHTPSPSTVA